MTVNNIVQNIRVCLMDLKGIFSSCKIHLDLNVCNTPLMGTRIYNKQDNVQLCETQIEYMMTLTCCQDHILTENICTHMTVEGYFFWNHSS